MARTQLNLEKAREMRKWWAENVHRVHDGEIRARALRRVLAFDYGVAEETVAKILSQKTHKEPTT